MADDWKRPWAGGCRCGRLRFQVTAPPMLSTACHCRGCQSMTGSAYSLSLSVLAAGFHVSRGEPVPGGLHGPNQHLHCSFCLSWVFTRPAGLDWMVNVRAPALDDHGCFAPYVEIETAEGFPWAKTAHRTASPACPGRRSSNRWCKAMPNKLFDLPSSAPPSA